MLARIYLALALAVFSQLVLAGHAHVANDQHISDCFICLKLEAGSHAILATALWLLLTSFCQHIVVNGKVVLLVYKSFIPYSRAPPVCC